MSLQAERAPRLPATSSPSADESFSRRLALATERLVTPRIIWLLFAIFVLARVVNFVFIWRTIGLPDGLSFWWFGRHLWSDPGSVYPQAAFELSRGHMPPAIGGGNLQPPPQAFLAAPFALIPLPWGVWLWVAIDLGCAVFSLWLLMHATRTQDPLARASLWLAAVVFGPAQLDVRIGQRGGLLMLLAIATAVLAERRPRLAGTSAGLAAALKLYPAALLLGVRPQRRLTLAASALLTAGIVLALTFVPFGSPAFYIRRVLLPTFTGGVEQQDCAQDSVRLLFARLVGGSRYFMPGPGGVNHLVPPSPLHLPALATGLTMTTLAALVIGAIWASRRSGWSPLYSFTLAFSLGALVPGEVYPYQFLPLLPLVCVLLVRLIERRQLLHAGGLVACLVPFAGDPCSLFFPGLWTISALAIFALGATSASLFREPLNEPGARGAPERNVD